MRQAFPSLLDGGGFGEESLLQELMDFLYRASISSLLIRVGRLGSEDLPGLWSRALIQVCTENHGGSKTPESTVYVEDVAAGYRRSGYVFSAHDVFIILGNWWL